MSESIYPTTEEIPEIAARPGSMVWRYGGDARPVAVAGYALLLQVAHPTVGAGVKDHSNFRADPWGRLLRTLDFVYLLTYGGPEAAAQTGRWVREMHKRIKGTARDGTRYHALEPEAYAWVHATLAKAVVVGHRRFGLGMTDAEADAYWREWRLLGRLLGVRDRDLPEDWDGFGAYFDEMVETRLGPNETVTDVLETLERPVDPPLPRSVRVAWPLARVLASRGLTLSTTGLLPPVLRERLGLRWRRRDELELRAIGRMSRAATPVMPRSLRNVGPAYLRWRRGPISRTYLAGAPGALPFAA
jgi:uncharacterized protein (DUF2236 family)